ncbi:hypothetical protein BDN70DRAFT_231930 [Pholiota conissans]|uniref:Uncharacterized protein n=1 Tax=Pholiota conissans TaxID=109636 RepID=A0A9P6CQZ4_9AGAR|nr:hypothetical protein BDN70DRAFT_231930 [Pholiota conissans]
MTQTTHPEHPRRRRLIQKPAFMRLLFSSPDSRLPTPDSLSLKLHRFSTPTPSILDLVPGPASTSSQPVAASRTLAGGSGDGAIVAQLERPLAAAVMAAHERYIAECTRRAPARRRTLPSSNSDLEVSQRSPLIRVYGREMEGCRSEVGSGIHRF